MQLLLRDWKLIGITALMLVLLVPVDGEDAPVVLPKFNVIESVMKVKVLINYHQMGRSPAYVTRVTIDEVKAGSFAEEIGLRSGMELIAIQGKRLTGLTQLELERVLTQPVSNTLVLLVSKSWWRKAEELRVNLPAIAAAKP